MNVMFLYTVDQIRQIVRAPYRHCHCTIKYSRRETHGSSSTRGAPVPDTTIRPFSKRGRDTDGAAAKVLEIRSAKGLFWTKKIQLMGEC